MGHVIHRDQMQVRHSEMYELLMHETWHLVLPTEKSCSLPTTILLQLQLSRATYFSFQRVYARGPPAFGNQNYIPRMKIPKQTKKFHVLVFILMLFSFLLIKIQCHIIYLKNKHVPNDLHNSLRINDMVKYNSIRSFLQ